ncbi:EF-P beta-lysylation protein EpmB [Agaribacterium sp. ZY112]|uniref:EF-P beta-lysylation protein EpmB n=1 Tax=Agaribacterium sp. ZY112 TaxID=3233574 RepID=UPI0035252808
MQSAIPLKNVITWQEELKNLISDPKELIQRLELDPNLLAAAQQACQLFPLRVSPSFLARVKKGQVNDPLLRQILPLNEELKREIGFSDDPLEEQQFNVLPGLVHKYKNRVLHIATSSCAINCRYCFRRSFAYEENRCGQQQWLDILDYLHKHPEIDEFIFSGGDPLLMTDEHIRTRLSQLAAISHIQRVRWHTRIPIVLSSRITKALAKALSHTRLQAIMVIHCNHAQELDECVKQGLDYLHSANITLLNQAVLLRGVNDCPETQIALSHSLFKNKVLPYYLHILDKVNGAAHFTVHSNDAHVIYQEMRRKLSGYLLPKLVKEEAGQIAKTPL